MTVTCILVSSKTQQLILFCLILCFFVSKGPNYLEIIDLAILLRSSLLWASVSPSINSVASKVISVPKSLFVFCPGDASTDSKSPAEAGQAVRPPSPGRL